ncbi:hypothetical protein KIL84_013253 [Mauremys mutica]|uniref:Uncharacterized protein n=1 Tax=Mauremys mutica TaxID=74926 RepID=A0A9D3WXQ1_9SAUR|nr:hypothetical protein KIL84_013253 [Mauremys mutica]
MVRKSRDKKRERGEREALGSARLQLQGSAPARALLRLPHGPGRRELLGRAPSPGCGPGGAGCDLRTPFRSTCM